MILYSPPPSLLAAKAKEHSMSLFATEGRPKQEGTV